VLEIIAIKDFFSPCIQVFHKNSQNKIFMNGNENTDDGRMTIPKRGVEDQGTSSEI
jgi:hypothetical protein